MKYYVRNTKSGELVKFKDKFAFVDWISKHADNDGLTNLELLNAIDDPRRIRVLAIVHAALPKDYEYVNNK